MWPRAADRWFGDSPVHLACDPARTVDNLRYERYEVTLTDLKILR